MGAGALQALWWAGRAARGLASVRNGCVFVVGCALAGLPGLAGPAGHTVAMEPNLPAYPHQAYAYGLAQTRWRGASSAREWFAAAERALLTPEPAVLPFAAEADFRAHDSAGGYAFGVPAGRRVSVALVPGDSPAGEVFVDLFKTAAGRYERVAGSLPGSGATAFTVDIVEDGDYVLRVQPSLGVVGRFELEIESRPLLEFPVDGVDRSAIWSAFGAERDGGRRAHRGVDIFASRGTPALAALDGWVTRVETTRVGGNVVWLQPLFGTMRLYYAHLDEQWVEPGDFVRTGQLLGAVGNTGNAITTPPHLHFGVYVRQPGRRGGARDPAEFLR